MSSLQHMNRLISTYLATQSTTKVSPNTISHRTSIAPKTCRYLLRTFFQPNMCIRKNKSKSYYRYREGN